MEAPELQLDKPNSFEHLFDNAKNKIEKLNRKNASKVIPTGGQSIMALFFGNIQKVKPSKFETKTMIISPMNALETVLVNGEPVERALKDIIEIPLNGKNLITALTDPQIPMDPLLNFYEIDSTTNDLLNITYKQFLSKNYKGTDLNQRFKVTRIYHPFGSEFISTPAIQAAESLPLNCFVKLWSVISTVSYDVTKPVESRRRFYLGCQAFTQVVFDYKSVVEFFSIIKPTYFPIDMESVKNRLSNKPTIIYIGPDYIERSSEAIKLNSSCGWTTFIKSDKPDKSGWKIERPEKPDAKIWTFNIAAIQFNPETNDFNSIVLMITAYESFIRSAICFNNAETWEKFGPIFTSNLNAILIATVNEDSYYLACNKVKSDHDATYNLILQAMLVDWDYHLNKYGLNVSEKWVQKKYNIIKRKRNVNSKAKFMYPFFVIDEKTATEREELISNFDFTFHVFLNKPLSDGKVLAKKDLTQDEIEHFLNCKNEMDMENLKKSDKFNRVFGHIDEPGFITIALQINKKESIKTLFEHALEENPIKGSNILQITDDIQQPKKKARTMKFDEDEPTNDNIDLF